MDTELETSLGKLQRKIEARDVEEKLRNSSDAVQDGAGETPTVTEGKTFDLSLKRASLKLEQNLGCELPVCVASRSETKRECIEVTTDEGVIWQLARTTRSLLPAPEHYPYWLWFLDRCHAAYELGWTEAPAILLNPPEIFDLFGAPKKPKSEHRSGYHGSRYDTLDAAFERFSNLVVSRRTAFFDGKRTYSGRDNLGTLCMYRSWRAKPQKGQQVLEFAKGRVAPGALLWESIKAGYLKSVPLEPLKYLTYVEQRLMTYLSKHCQPGGQFSISPEKLLPKIPLECPPDQLHRRLDPRHEALAKIGFLYDARIEGRGSDKVIVYQRPKGVFPPPPLRLVESCPLLK